jgi:hypothetical protein
MKLLTETDLTDETECVAEHCMMTQVVQADKNKSKIHQRSRGCHLGPQTIKIHI